MVLFGVQTAETAALASKVLAQLSSCAAMKKKKTAKPPAVKVGNALGQALALDAGGSSTY